MKEKSTSVTVISWLYIIISGICFLMYVPQLVLYKGFQKGMVKVSGEAPRFPIFGVEINMEAALFALTMIGFLTVIASVLLLLRSNAGRILITAINILNTIVLIGELAPLANFSYIFKQGNIVAFLICFLLILFYASATILLYKKKEEFR